MRTTSRCGILARLLRDLTCSAFLRMRLLYPAFHSMHVCYKMYALFPHMLYSLPAYQTWPTGLHASNMDYGFFASAFCTVRCNQSNSVPSASLLPDK